MIAHLIEVVVLLAQDGTEQRDVSFKVKVSCIQDVLVLNQVPESLSDLQSIFKFFVF